MWGRICLNWLASPGLRLSGFPSPCMPWREDPGRTQSEPACQVSLFSWVSLDRVCQPASSSPFRRLRDPVRWNLCLPAAALSSTPLDFLTWGCASNWEPRRRLGRGSFSENIQLGSARVCVLPCAFACVHVGILRE